MRKKRMRKDEKREITPEFVNMSKEILYPQIQGVTALTQALAPCRGRSPRLRWDPVVRSSGAVASRTRHPECADRRISDVHPRSGDLGLIKTDSIATVRCESNYSALLPSPAPLPLGLAGQAISPRTADTPGPLVSPRSRSRARPLGQI
jgi:hypothetical protein